VTALPRAPEEKESERDIVRRKRRTLSREGEINSPEKERQTVGRRRGTQYGE